MVALHELLSFAALLHVYYRLSLHVFTHEAETLFAIISLVSQHVCGTEPTELCLSSFEDCREVSTTIYIGRCEVKPDGQF